VFRPPETDSIEQTYVGEGIPLGASKMTVDAYHRRLDYEPSDSTRTSVIVVCNEDEMAEENVVSDSYGTREWTDFDIRIENNLTTEEMKNILHDGADFLHYVGHVDEEGIRCSDGWLDVEDLDEVNINAFLLNACKSYEQGSAFIEKGAIGGIVTVSDVLNKTATKIGRTVAHLIDTGFTISSSIQLLEKESLVANQYLVVGDGNTTLIENESGTPTSIRIRRMGSGDFRMGIFAYPSRTLNMGSLYSPNVRSEERQFLNSGEIVEYDFSPREVSDYISMGKIPIEMNGSIFWSDSLDISRLRGQDYS
jgi:hypothetical protein